MVRTSSRGSALRRRWRCLERRFVIEDVFDQLAALVSHLLTAAQRLESLHRRPHHVVWIRAAQTLGKDVVDPGALDDRAHGTPRDDARSGGGRFEKDTTTAEMTEDLMGNRHAVERHAKHVLSGLIVALADGLGHLVGLA